MEQLKIVECPRDAMQGIHEFIPTEKKVRYINQLLQVGFDTLDFGSFVSPRAIPQMKDTKQVLQQLDLSATKTKLLAIVGNLRGAKNACEFDEVNAIGFPFSISDTFQKRNINSSIEDSFNRAEIIHNEAIKKNKELVVYISMAFGNPYGDPWNKEIAIEWSHRLNKELEIKTISLSDTIGIATPDVISYLFDALIPAIPDVEFGAHLHTTPDTWKEKVEAAYTSGCKRMDGAIKGYGGCPMAKDDLTGNMPTENLIAFMNEKSIAHQLNQEAFAESMALTLETFPH
ncbi:MAG: hydroxymethylglutaryl-CoA lyase [Crocinitomicaceae bacterium]|nr:hydroxymethylglutaryl-CoA lyase [Crocinitomicaceae bacterium]